MSHPPPLGHHHFTPYPFRLPSQLPFSPLNNPPLPSTNLIMRLSSITTFALLSTLAGVLASDVADLTAGSFKGEVMDADLALVE